MMIGIMAALCIAVMGGLARPAWAAGAGVPLGGGVPLSGTARECEVPAFLATGKAYRIFTGMADATVIILEVDRHACWMKGDIHGRGVGWINLRQVHIMQEVHMPPTPAPSAPDR
jgi:hypothetical protein